MLKLYSDACNTNPNEEEKQLRNPIKDSGFLQISFQNSPHILLVSATRQRHLKYQPLASSGFSTLDKCARQCLLQCFTEKIFWFSTWHMKMEDSICDWSAHSQLRKLKGEEKNPNHISISFTLNISWFCNKYIHH